MRNRLQPALAVLLLAAALPARAQINLATYVAVGDSLTAGFESGSLVVTHQTTSFPALLARQAGIPSSSFQQPTVSEPGVPAELTLVTLLPSPLIAPKSATSGSPTNSSLSRPYNNLGIPGATSTACLNTTSGGYFDLILRGQGTQIQQALNLRPTFVTLWIGPSDVLGAVINGQAIDGVTLTPVAAFAQNYQQIVNSLRTTTAVIVAANIPDVTLIPFATTIPRVVVNSAGIPVLVNGAPVPLIGPNGPLPPGTLVTLNAQPLIAQGVGIPTSLGGQGTPLPDQVILDPGEIATIREHIRINNLAISQICQAAGIPVLDAHAIYDEFAVGGRVIGGIKFDNAILTGGIFSYDGIHPTDLGYAIIANDWINLLNSRGASIPIIDLGPYTGVTSSSVSSAVVAPSVSGSAVGVLSGRGSRVSAPPLPAVALEFSQEAYQNLLATFPPFRD